MMQAEAAESDEQHHELGSEAPFSTSRAGAAPSQAQWPRPGALRQPERQRPSVPGPEPLSTGSVPGPVTQARAGLRISGSEAVLNATARARPGQTTAAT